MLSRFCGAWSTCLSKNEIFCRRKRDFEDSVGVWPTILQTLPLDSCWKCINGFSLQGNSWRLRDCAKWNGKVWLFGEYEKFHKYQGGRQILAGFESIYDVSRFGKSTRKNWRICEPLTGHYWAKLVIANWTIANTNCTSTAYNLDKAIFPMGKKPPDIRMAFSDKPHYQFSCNCPNTHKFPHPT